MNILSLFDGMSCDRIALQRSNIKVDNYFASEIDKYAIKVSTANYPDIIQVGDITKLQYKEETLITSTGEHKVDIDLLIGGSPCQTFSSLGNQTGFEGKSGLFWEYIRLLKEVKPRYFLLENVRMKQEWEDIISKELGVKPIRLNSSLVSAQSRNRLYWTNIPVNNPEDKGITLSSIVDKNASKKYYLSEKAKKYICSKERLSKQLCNINGTSDDKSTILLARYTGLNGTFLCVDCNGNLSSEKSGTLLARYAKGVSNFGGDSFVLDGDNFLDFNIRRFTPNECEKLQTVPIDYTNYVSDTQRYKMLGNGWTVDIISHIFNGLNESNK
jgi:site-specific DNA-cytosine methylase